MDGTGMLGLTFSRNLRLAREKARMSRARLAGEAGVSAPYLRWLEAGDRTPTLGLLQRLAEALDVPAWTLLCEDGDLVDGDGGRAEELAKRFREELEPLVDALFADARQGRHI